MSKKKICCDIRCTTCVESFVEKVRVLSAAKSVGELFLRATLVFARRKLNPHKAAAAETRLREEGRLVHWIRRILHKVAMGRLVLPELQPA